MYWSLWDVADNGTPFLENVLDEYVDDRIKHNPNEIVFEAELTTE